MANPTLEDAHAALLRHAGDGPSTEELEVVFGFLNRLIGMTEPDVVINSDAEGYIIEGAMQSGFQSIDDSAGLHVVHTNDLIKYVLEQRASAAALALQTVTRTMLPPVVLSMRDESELGRLVNEFGNTPIFGEGRLRCDVFDDLRELFGISQAATAAKLVGDAKAAKALRCFVAILEEMGFGTDESIGGADTVQVICEQYPTLKEALK